jgi:hypothetical protein
MNQGPSFPSHLPENNLSVPASTPAAAIAPDIAAGDQATLEPVLRRDRFMLNVWLLCCLLMWLITAFNLLLRLWAR